GGGERGGGGGGGKGGGERGGEGRGCTIGGAARGGLGRVAAELGRHGKACCRLLPRRPVPASHGAVRRRNGSPRRHAVRGDEHEPGAATALRFARRQAEGRSHPGTAPRQALRPRWRALMTTLRPTAGRTTPVAAVKAT